MVIMSIDLGKSRTGLAICDKSEILASPLGVIAEKNEEILAQKICANIELTSTRLVIIGLPKNMDGSQGESSTNTSNFCKILQKYTDVPIELWDERLTTISASLYLNKTNTRGKKRKNIIDTVSAVIILENYLNYRKNKGLNNSD